MKTLVAALLILVLEACCWPRRRYVIEQMEWDAGPVPGYPRPQPLPPDAVHLTYTSGPGYSDLVGGVPGLLDHLRASGKRIVLVKFEVTCNCRGVVAGAAMSSFIMAARHSA